MGRLLGAGYAEMRKIAMFGMESAEAIIKVKAATTVIERVKALAGVSDDIADLVTLDLATLKKEWQARTPETFTLLMDDLRGEFDIEDDGLEAKIEASVEGGLFVLEEVAAMADRWRDRFPLTAS